MTVGAGATLGTGLTTNWWGLDSDKVFDPKTEGDQIIPTFCELCFWKCGVLAHVRNGQVTKLVGNPKHPLSNGKLCPRGVGGIGTLYDPDRLKSPLLRTSKRGEQVFTAIPWTEALDRVASGMKDLEKKYGAESLALFNHGFGASWFTHLMKVYGSPNMAAPSYAQCRGPRDVGYSLTTGSGLGSPEPVDIGGASCITLIGSHLGENMHNTQVQEFADAMARGTPLVVVDPRFSIAAGKAKFWLPIKPGTDIALLLAWMHVILTEKRYDADYLAKHAMGLDELKKHVADKTPEWAQEITGITSERIRESARFIAAFRPNSLIHPGRHVTWYGDDAQRSRAMAILGALLGNHGRRGGILTPSKMSLPAYPLPENKKSMRAPADKPSGGIYPFADEVLASGLCEAALPGKSEYAIKGWLVYGSNLIQTLPNPKQTQEAIHNLDLLVSIDILPSDICGWSDIVLPECTYLERNDDLYAAYYKQPFVALRQKVIEPLGDSKPGWWIAKEIAKRLGLDAQFPWQDVDQYIQKRVSLAGLNWKELTSTGVILGTPKPTCEEEGLSLAFETESQKIELYSKALKKAGFDPIPNFHAHEEPPTGMFRLLMGRSPVHTFGRTTNNALLLESFPENEVWIHTDAASRLTNWGQPMKSGDRVYVINQDGAKTGPIKVKVTERIREDCVYMVHGFGHSAKGLTKGQIGGSDSDLITRTKVDPLMGGTGMNVNFVRLEKAEVIA